jgi:hypothetical protein
MADVGPSCTPSRALGLNTANDSHHQHFDAFSVRCLLLQIVTVLQLARSSSPVSRSAISPYLFYSKLSTISTGASALIVSVFINGVVGDE